MVLEDGATELAIAHDATARRYSGRLSDGTVVSVADYVDDPERGTRSFVYTETKPQYGGRGFAGQVVAFALEDTRAAGLKPVPACSYVALYMAQHPDQAD